MVENFIIEGTAISKLKRESPIPKRSAIPINEIPIFFSKDH